jgi:D-serine deaminase-like pyridoxal phosphate-dependent protein
MTASLPLPLDPAAVLPVPVGDARLDTPAMLVDLDVAEANIASMAGHARRAGVLLRPHVKTHKSVAMARRQLAAGAVGLCVATVGEAEVFTRAVTDRAGDEAGWATDGAAGSGPAGSGPAGSGPAGSGLAGSGLAGSGSAGVAPLTLAYPVVGARKLSRLAEVCRGVPVTLVADSAAVVDGYAELARRAGRTVTVLAEVDTGMHRAGAAPHAVPELARQISKTDGLDFGGILTHAGHAHDAAGQLGIERVARQEATVMGDVRADLERAGHEVRVVSAGSTLTARYLTAADGITEIRPGTYVYNDLRTLACWSCTAEQIAASMLATVVSVGEDGRRVTVDAGSKTLTTTTDPAYGHGHLAGQPDAAVTRLSEEHGVLTVAGPPPSVGDLVRILPVHVCVWSDLQPEVYGVRHGEITERIRVDAFRHSL